MVSDFPSLFLIVESNVPANPPAPTSIGTDSSFVVPPSPTQSTLPFIVEQYVNPYHMHHSNSTNFILVSDLLTESNYNSWSRAMLIGLLCKNKVGFVDGSLLCPTENLRSSWIICNGVVTPWILNSLSKEIYASVNFTYTAHEIWLDLQNRYQRQNRPRFFQLRRDLSNLAQDQHTITTYFSRLQTLWNELISYRSSCTCDRCSCEGMKKLIDYFQTEHGFFDGAQ